MQSWFPRMLEQVLLVCYQSGEPPLLSAASAITTSSQRVGLGAECSPEMYCHHISQGCEALINILAICRESLVLLLDISFIRHFSDLSWIVVDLFCFSEVCSSTNWYVFCVFFCSGKRRSPRTDFLASPALLFHGFWTLLLHVLYIYAPSAFYSFKSLFSSQRSRMSLRLTKSWLYDYI